MDCEEEEQYEEMQAEPQAEVIEIDAEDAPYLDLRDDRERQGYAILKNQDSSKPEHSIRTSSSK